MARNSVNDYSTTASENTDIQSINIAEQCPASNINNAIRQLMAHLADAFQGAMTATSLKATTLWAGTANIEALVLGSGTATATAVSGARQITAGRGLSGGGDLSADRALALDVNNLTATATVLSTDSFPFYSTGSATGTYRATKSSLAATDSFAGFAEFATVPETQALTATDRAVTPAGLAAVGAPELLATISTASGGTKTETGLPKCRAFFIVLAGVSLTVTGSVSLAVSADGGTSWSGNVALDSGVGAGYQGGANIWLLGTAVIGSKIVTGVRGPNNDAGNMGMVNAVISSVTGVINAMRFSPSGGNFDNGNIYIFGIR